LTLLFFFGAQLTEAGGKGGKGGKGKKGAMVETMVHSSQLPFSSRFHGEEKKERGKRRDTDGRIVSLNCVAASSPVGEEEKKGKGKRECAVQNASPRGGTC